MRLTTLAYEETGGIPVAPGGASGGLITTVGQVQYGDMLLGSGTPAGWRELIGWRDTPDASISDSPRPQSHGTYPGLVLGDGLTVTFTYLLRGTPSAKALALDTIEKYTRMDSVDRMLCVNDTGSVWFRRARVISRKVPQDRNFNHAPLECGVQFLCSDPRRYALIEQSVTVSMPTSVGGLDYPLVYPLSYGTSSVGQKTATNGGSEDTPVTVTFRGPLTNPVLVAAGQWRLGFTTTLAAGETLVVDTANGTALLNGDADRLSTITTDSDPLELDVLPPGSTQLTLTADSGTGTVDVAWHDARL